MLGPEFIEFAPGSAFHAFANPVDVRARHVVELAVVPNELDVRETLLKALVVSTFHPSAHIAQIHGVFHNRGVVE